MFEQLIQYNNVGLLVLRIAVAAIFIYHALPKLKNARVMAQMMGTQTAMVFALGAVEFLSSLGLVFGFYTQLASLLLGVVMIGAIGMKIMKWNAPFSAMDKTGWEFDLVLLAASIAILLGGGGTIGIQ